MKYILSIDQGTTGTRAVVYDKLARQIGSAYREFTQYFPRPGWVEHDPAEIWDSVRSTINNAARRLPKGSIEAIGITNQRETTVIWDRETGRPIHRAICWQCRRTSGRCDSLKRKRGEKEFFLKRTGLPIDAYFSATKIEWILKNVPGAMSKARSGRLLFGTTDSWVLWNLTGGAVHATDHTNASRTMLFNIEKMEWDDLILKRFDIPKAMLPEVRNSSGFFGNASRLVKPVSGIPVAGMAGDQQAALFGQACFTPGTIKNTYGTGCFILLNSGKKRPFSKHGLITTLACGGKGEPVYALEGAIFVAGSAVQWLRDGLKLLEKASESEAMARSVKDNAGVYFVPALVGLGAPYWAQDARGSIYNLTRGTNRNHIVRAALEAICYQTRDVIEAMEKDTGLKIRGLKVDGGASANDFICQFQADILGMDVIRPKAIEITSLGAAYLAGFASGYWKDKNDIEDNWRVDRIFRPRMKRGRASRLYEGWIEAVRKTIG